jgi:hypothetical protein
MPIIGGEANTTGYLPRSIRRTTKEFNPAMTISRVGATKRYSDNWEQIFGRGGKRSAAKSKAVQKSPASRTGKKSAKKKTAKKARRRK